MFSDKNSSDGNGKSLRASILDVELLDVGSENIRAFSIDYPKIQANIEGHELIIAGWVLAQSGSLALEVGASNKGKLLKSFKLNISRSDVVTAYGLDESLGNKFGFYCKLSVVGLDRLFELDVDVKMQSSLGEIRDIQLCRITAEKNSTFITSPEFLPIRVTALGRSGTTLLMQILGAHESILITNFYPYEVKLAQYWLQFFRVASAPADFENSAHPGEFSSDLYKIGHNPYNHPQFTNQYRSPQRIEDHYSTTVLNSLADFSVAQINDYYRLIAEDESKPEAIYFAEKFSPNHQLTSICNDLYPGSKEIILTRDFRDMLCSAHSFNVKRNTQGFGRARVSNDFAWVDAISEKGLQRLWELWRERKNSSLHVKYENLVLDSENEIGRILDYLELENDAVITARIRQAIFSNGANHAIHQTSKSPEDSIGRWKMDMPEELQAYCLLKFGNVLEGFGYAV